MKAAPANHNGFVSASFSHFPLKLPRQRNSSARRSGCRQSYALTTAFWCFLKQEPTQGLTLIELLVVITIMGILSAIALPSFLNQANRARESEAKQYIGTVNRAQQVYFLEAGEFVDNAHFSLLGLSLDTQTANYTYEIAGGGTGSTSATHQAKPQLSAQAAVRAYIGGVTIGMQIATGEATTLGILCEANQPPTASGDVGTATVMVSPLWNQPICPAGYRIVG